MNSIVFFVFISSIPIINSTYNPVPMEAVIISTTHTISAMRPYEFGGSDKPTIIFTALKNMIIINTIFDSTQRDLYILFTNTTSNLSYISRLASVGQLDTVVYQLPISYNTSEINQLTSFSPDSTNKRAFLSDRTGAVTMFSMAGVMKQMIKIPATIPYPVRSVSYNPALDRLFIITDSTVDACTYLDQNDLQCCQSTQKSERLRSITFEPATSSSLMYVMDERTGIYQVVLDNATFCPMAIRPINTMGTYKNIHLAIHQDVYFCSGSTDTANYYSSLIIGNRSNMPRTITFDAPIVALHVSYPTVKSSMKSEESCFHGITYHDYRLAVILAALFATFMGILMCFNALFCIDFFMTKQIIGNLKKQIPHNRLDDRWNKLVNEKYAKIALEIHRKKDDPPSKRKSSASARKILTSDTVQVTGGGDTYQVANPIPKISSYFRRKSESYLARRSRSVDNRTSSQTTEGRPALTSKRADTVVEPQVQVEEVNEQGHQQKQRQDSASHDDSGKIKGELL